MVDTLSREHLEKLARLGAAARLRELEAEIAEIRAAFPDVAAGAAAEPTPAGRKRRARRPAAERQKPAAEAKAARVKGKGGRKKKRQRDLTPAEREAISNRMKRYWAKVREQKAAAAPEAGAAEGAAVEAASGDERPRARKRGRKR